MAITYPRSLPNNARMAECWFDLIDNASVSIAGQTKVNISQVFPPSWRGTFATGLLERTERPIWSAWKKSLRSAGMFVAYDVRHSAPLAYPNAKFPADVQSGWNGTAVISSLGLSGALALLGLPIGYQFKTGDRVGLEKAGKYGYYEILEDVTASGVGAATVTVAPFLHTSLFDTTATCRVWRPVCQFIMDKGSWSEQGTVEITPVSFTGTQRL